MRQKSLFTGFIVDNFWLFRTRTVFMLKNLFFLRTFCPKACIPQPNRVLYYYKEHAPSQAASRPACSPSGTLCHLPRTGESIKGRALGKTANFAWTAKASHFEERLPPRRGKMSPQVTKGGGGIAQAMTERARMQNKRRQHYGMD